MGDGLDFALERPIALLLLGLIPIFAWAAWRRRSAIGAGRVWLAITVRSLLITLLALSLAQPTARRRGEGVSTIAILDVSDSIPEPLRTRAFRMVEQALESRQRPIDRLGLVTVGRNAVTLSMPSTAPGTLDDAGITERDATDLESAVRRSLALLPPDTSNRLLLVSDGNESIGSLREAAMAARVAGVPIDVVPQSYRRDGEVVMESVHAPSRGRVAQGFDLKVVLRAPRATPGTLFLKQDATQVDLSPGEPGDGVAVELKAGATTIRLPVELVHPGASRFQVTFVPAAESGDMLPQNNAGEAIVFAGGEGRVLIIDPTAGQGGVESAVVASALRKASIEVDVVEPSSVSDPLTLAAYDAVILANVARYDISNALDRGIKSYVEGLGGGLWVLGGDHSFGVGGWIGSETATILPVLLDPPATRELPRGALALVMHSCELPEGNYWSEQIALAAIDSLSGQDFIGIIAFAWNANGNGSSWELPMQLAGDKARARAVARTMSVGDMPDFGSSMALALEGLQSVRAGQRHAIIISDGDPSPPSRELLDRFAAAGITITTIMVAGHGTATDLQNMRAIAERTGGTFHNVVNPKMLPKVVTKEATMISRSLIMEGDFQPVVSASASGPMAGVSAVPPIGGYVVTVPRGGLSQSSVVNLTADARDPGRSYDDPIVSWWNHGTGRVAVLTTDLTGRWGGAWVQWSGLESLVERTARWLMRPASPQDASIRASLDGETLQVEVETGEGESRVAGRTATVLRPDGTTAPMQLEQVAPGRWRGTAAADARGAYLVQVPLASASGAAGGMLHAAASASYPREYATTRDNAALLEEVAELTGGRVLSIDSAVSANIFLADGLKVPVSQRRIWDVLALAAALGLLLDIAVRRIVIERGDASSFAARVLGTTSAGSDAGVQALRRARSARTAPPDAPSASPASPRHQRATAPPPPSPSVPPTAVSDAARTAGENESDADGHDALSPLERLRRARERARREASDHE